MKMPIVYNSEFPKGRGAPTYCSAKFVQNLYENVKNLAKGGKGHPKF